MSEIKKTASGKNYTAASAGALSGFEGKAFFKEALGSTALEVSLGSLPTGVAVPIFHSHKKNEELYIVISGSGEFLVDEDVFDIAPGSFVRVAPAGIRNIRCTSAEPLVYLCVQAQAGSLTACTGDDANIVEHRAKW